MENLLFTFTKKKNLSEFIVEQRVKSNEQRIKSNEQRAKNNDQRAKSNEQRAKSNELQATSEKFHLYLLLNENVYLPKIFTLFII